MNIFFLDVDPKKCAEYHCDKHVVKMLLEIVQLLFTVHHLLGTPAKLIPYKPIKNFKHPMCIWITLDINNYLYAVKLGLCLAQEYTYRYLKVHSCEKHVVWLNDNIPLFKEFKGFKGFKLEYSVKTILSKYKIKDLTYVPLCMPEDSITSGTSGTSDTSDTIKSYRKYYLIHKKYFAKWTKRPIPEWFHYSDIRNYFEKLNE